MEQGTAGAVAAERDLLDLQVAQVELAEVPKAVVLEIVLLASEDLVRQVTLVAVAVDVLEAVDQMVEQVDQESLLLSSQIQGQSQLVLV
jgi:hypothetical protein